jgi:hypothetical protein
MTLNHIDTRAVFPSHPGSCMVYRPEWYRKQKHRQLSYPTGHQKSGILIIDIHMVLKMDNIRPTLANT